MSEGRLSRKARAAVGWLRDHSFLFATLLDLRRSRSRRKAFAASPRARIGDFEFPFVALADLQHGADSRNLALKARLARPGASYPRLASGFDPRSLRPPMVLAGFHFYVGTAMQALFERLPAEVLMIARASGGRGGRVRHVWPGHDLDAPGNPGRGEWERVRAIKEGVDALRAGQFVVTTVDYVGTAHVPATLFGEPVLLRGGGFALSRLGKAPMLPVTGRWRGPRVQIVHGEPIPPDEDEVMAAALMRWLEGYLRENPRYVSRTIWYMVKGVPQSVASSISRNRP
jgi:hypothetical protein